MPIVALLREHLAAQRLAQPPGAELCFGPDGRRPFHPDNLQTRADKAWATAGLTASPSTTAATRSPASPSPPNVNAKALSNYMGHATVAFTLDLYGHLMPGNEAEAADLLDTYLEASR